MPSAVAEQHIRANNLIQMWDHDPGATSALITTPDGGTTDRMVDMRDYEQFAVAVMTTVLGGNGVTKVEIVAATDSAGTNATAIKDSGTVAADAMGDWVCLECSADEVRYAGDAAGLALRYVGARITCHHAGDEAVVVYFGVSNRPQLDLTPATTIA